MNPLDHDAFLTSGPGGPDEDDGPDYACTREEFDAVEKVFEILDNIEVKDLKAMPREARGRISDAKDWLIDWLDAAEKQGIEPSANDLQCKKYGV